jgi:tRNA isopentenyl-2-thiomethyl-A-37 hydroxylase MiaE
MKKLIVLFALLALTLAALAGAAGTKGTWTGWVTDEHCGAKGASADHKACAEKCAGNGSKLVFYNNADKKVYGLDKQDVAKANLGHEVKVSGELDGKNIKVDSISAAGAGK